MKDNDGWIDWNGEEENPPVDALVEVRFVDFSTDTEWPNKYYWKHHGEIYDIVAYRVIELNIDESGY